MPLRRPRRTAVAAALVLTAVVAGAAVATAASTVRSAPGTHAPPALSRLAPMRAATGRTDTLFLGGYARGSFAEALQTVASDLSSGERTVIGRHLDGMFAGVLRGEDLERGGRLRLAYERTLRPDGSTRAIRVLAAEAAADGVLHRAFFYEQDGRPAYFDAAGRSLEARAWAPPLERLRVTSPFGRARMHPLLERVLPHNGTDYGAPSGTPVRAAADGSVAAAERRGGYGNLVELQHPNGYATRYAHLSGFAPGVTRGAAVRQGDVIGYVGMTGLATGPHLHYEVRRGGQPVDPERAAALGDGPAAELTGDHGWRGEYRRLTALLERAPRALQMTRAAEVVE